METKGVVACARPTSDPLGLKAIPVPALVGSVAGLAYLVPKPPLDHGYMETKGVVVCARPTSDPLGLKAIPLPPPVGNVAGLNSISQNIEESDVDEAYQMPSVNTSGRGGEGGRRFIPNQLPFPQNIRKRFGEHIVFNPGSGTLYISDILYNNLVKGYANQPAIKKLIMDIPPMVKQLLNKTKNYGKPKMLSGYKFKQYFPFAGDVEIAEDDKFNKDGTKKYYSKGNYLFQNLNKQNALEEDMSINESKLRTIIRSIIAEEVTPVKERKGFSNDDLLTLGLSLLASKSPNFMTALGEAGLATVAGKKEREKIEREQAKSGVELDYMKARTKEAEANAALIERGGREKKLELEAEKMIQKHMADWMDSMEGKTGALRQDGGLAKQREEERVRTAIYASLGITPIMRSTSASSGVGLSASDSALINKYLR